MLHYAVVFLVIALNRRFVLFRRHRAMQWASRRSSASSSCPAAPSFIAVLDATRLASRYDGQVTQSIFGGLIFMNTTKKNTSARTALAEVARRRPRAIDTPRVYAQNRSTRPARRCRDLRRDAELAVEQLARGVQQAVQRCLGPPRPPAPWPSAAWRPRPTSPASTSPDQPCALGAGAAAAGRHHGRDRPG